MPQDKWAQYADKPDTEDKWAKYADQPSPANPNSGVLAPAAAPPGTTAKILGASAWDATKDIIRGARKGVLNTLTGLSEPIHSIPGIGPKLIPDEGLNALKAWKTPRGAAEQFGHTAEQVGEWFLPTGLEGKAETAAATALPKIARYAKPAARIGAQALETGVRNKLQGGDFTTGAAIGGGTGALAEGGKALAPRVMEAALGIPRRVRKYGATPGETALSETRSFRPSSLANETDGIIKDLDKSATIEAQRSPLRGSLQEARGLIEEEIANAQERNAPGLLQKLSKVKNQLTQEFDATGRPIMVRPSIATESPTGILDEFGHAITRPSETLGKPTPRLLPEEVRASKVRAMRQGVDEEIKGWTPPGTKPDTTIDAIRKRLYGTLSNEAHRSAPASAPFDVRMSSLIPVQEHAENKALAEGVIPQVMKRLQAPTGALVAPVGMALAGGGLGYKEGGLPGAVMGGGAGLLAPSLISNPALWISAARALNSPVPIRAARGLSLQLDRPDEEEQKSQARRRGENARP